MARVLVIGAMRRRQGTGEFVARSFADAGAEVAAVVGRTPASAAEAAGYLEDRYGVRARPYADAKAAVDAERPDVVAVCSPYEHHLGHLEIAAAAGADCLSEKPLVFDDRDDHRTDAERIVAAFAAAGRHLSLMTQWPRTLASFFELYPEERDRPLESLEMWLCPMFPGPRMIPDAVPHAVSLLQARTKGGRAADATAAFADESRRHLDLAFDWRAEEGWVRVRCSFTVKEEAPRPAAYALNGRRVDREIENPGYRMFLRAGDRRVEIPDPLDRQVRRFLDAAGYPDPAGPRLGKLADTAADDLLAAGRRDLVEGVAALDLLTRAARAWHK